MNLTYDDGVAVLTRWKDEHAQLWVEFWEPSQTSVSGRCFISDLTSEAATLQFGAIALGTLTLTLPVDGVFVARDSVFTYSKVDDVPPKVRSRLESFSELLELRYRFWGDGCRLLRFKETS